MGSSISTPFAQGVGVSGDSKRMNGHQIPFSAEMGYGPEKAYWSLVRQFQRREGIFFWGELRGVIYTDSLFLVVFGECQNTGTFQPPLMESFDTTNLQLELAQSLLSTYLTSRYMIRTNTGDKEPQLEIVTVPVEGNIVEAISQHGEAWTLFTEFQGGNFVTIGQVEGIREITMAPSEV